MQHLCCILSWSSLFAKVRVKGFPVTKGLNKKGLVSSYCRRLAVRSIQSQFLFGTILATLVQDRILS